MNRILLTLFCLILSVLSLTCKSDNPAETPTQPVFSNPWPPNAATGIATSLTLAWSCSGGGALSYDVYLATSTPPTVQVGTGQTVTTLSSGGLANSTTYYWMVDVKESNGVMTHSPVWSFTTASGIVTPGMVSVAGGTFSAGSTPVTIGSFMMDAYEVTYELWTDVRTWGLAHGYVDLVTGQNGSNPVGSHNPVTLVNWHDVVKWCNARSEMDGLAPLYYTDNTQSTVYRTGTLDLNVDAVNWSAAGYRLPTETEWEYAARGGNQSKGYTFSGSNIADNVAWYADNSGTRTHTVGTKSANELGLYDMSGNAGELCWDWFDAAYPSGGTTDPKGPSTSQTYRLLRGGFYLGQEITCNVSTRSYDANGPGYRATFEAFRCVRK